MENDLGLKLIAVVDLSRLRVYEAQGLKILKKLEQCHLSLHKEHSHEQGSYRKGSGPSSSFEPHTSEKDIEHNETAKIVIAHLEQLLKSSNQYKGLIITAESKLLGAIRHHMTTPLKKILVKELAKDLAHHDMAAIEQVVFQ